MKILTPLLRSLLLLIMFAGAVNAQNASTYFPSAPGYKWYYKNTPLDSLNNPQTSLATYQVDSFSNVTTFQGLSASTVLSKTGLANINQNIPYLDTNHFNFQSTNGFYYLNLLSYINSIPFLDSATFVNFLRSFETWYNVYRFGQTVNTNYTIFTKDTTVSFDTLTLPLRLSATGRRLNDQTISTVNGNYLAKKFIITFTLSYGLLPPILYIPIITRPDTAYFASGIWKIKDVMPSINVDLTTLGFPIAFSIPGNITELTNSSTGIINQGNLISENYRLYQNYPNPFNPKTIINYELGITGDVSLKIFDAEGKEIETLVNEKQTAGSYAVDFNGERLSSGIYFYHIIIHSDKPDAADFVETKRMILLK